MLTLVIIAVVVLILGPLITWAIMKGKETKERETKRIRSWLFPLLFAIFLSVGICITITGIIYAAAFYNDSRLYIGISFLAGGFVSISLCIVFRVLHKKSKQQEV
jgi:cytochrome bd-type quinol oxidase subunit 2